MEAAGYSVLCTWVYRLLRFSYIHSTNFSKVDWTVLCITERQPKDTAKGTQEHLKMNELNTCYGPVNQILLSEMLKIHKQKTTEDSSGKALQKRRTALC